ncbi:MAG: hypothetical protein AAGP08_04270 [Pseudomonadota bacterium]
MKTFQNVVAASTILAMSSVPVMAECISAFEMLEKQGGAAKLGGFSVSLENAPVFVPVSGSSRPQEQFNFVKPHEGSPCHGTEQYIWLSDATVYIVIQGDDDGANRVNVKYCDMGGFVNASANQSDPSSYIGRNLGGVPETLPNNDGVPVAVKADERQTRVGQITGEIVFEPTDDPLTFVRVGGEEFLITEICVE